MKKILIIQTASIGDVILATALAENFFSPACDMMEQGDTVLVSTTTGGALLFLQAVDKVEKSSTTVLMCRTPSIYGGSAV